MKHTCEELRQTLTKEFLIENLIIKKLSIPHVAINIVGCDPATLRKYVRNLKIEIISEWDKILTKEFLLQYAIDTPRGKVIPCGKILKITGYDFGLIKRRVLKLDLIPANRSEVKKDIIIYSKEHNERVRKSRLGSKSHFWKGGITPLNMLIRSLPEYRNWVDQCFYRDRYICQDCNHQSKELVVHHIKEFSEILKEFLQLYFYLDPIKDKEKLLELAKTYKPFWDINNGKTLCRECHKCYGKNNKKLTNKVEVVNNV